MRNTCRLRIARIVLWLVEPALVEKVRRGAGPLAQVLAERFQRKQQTSEVRQLISLAADEVQRRMRIPVRR